MKPIRCSFASLIFCIVTFTLAACGPESQPATPTLEPTITDTPQPSLTPTPTEIPLPPGSEELISRLEERATVEMNESGTFDLVYDDMAVGEMDDEGQIGFQVEGGKYPARKNISEFDFESLKERGYIGPGEVNFNQLEKAAPEYVEIIRRPHSPQGPDYWKELHTGISKLWFTPFKHNDEDFLNIKEPILFVIGARDNAIPVESAVNMFRLVPLRFNVTSLANVTLMFVKNDKRLLIDFNFEPSPSFLLNFYPTNGVHYNSSPWFL